MDFKVGDVVRLKSGGPKITVIQIEGTQVRCEWFEGKDSMPKRHLFQKETLDMEK